MAQQKPHAENPIVKTIEPRNADLGGFLVRRSLPVIGTREVGPWVFFDHSYNFV